MGKFGFYLASILVCQSCMFTIYAQRSYEFINSGCNGEYYNFTRGSVYERNLNLLVSDLASKSSSVKFYNSTIDRNSSDEVYGLFQCGDDLGLDICNGCVKNATTKITEECPLYGEAIVWYSECTLWYTPRSTFSRYKTIPGADRWDAAIVSNYAEFAPIFNNTMNDLINNASLAKTHFATRVTNWTVSNPLYSFAQCIPTIDASGCNACLNTALLEMTRCCNASVHAMVLYPSCQLRYNTTGPVLTDHPWTTQSQAGSASKNTGIIVALVVCISILLIGLSVVFWIYLCRKKPQEANCGILLASPRGMQNGSVNGNLASFGDEEFVQFDYATLKTATRDFSDENKLGEGTLGIVFKGTFESGQQLAIKSLNRTAGLEKAAFITEARLLAKLHHKNLVRLVGFCLEGDRTLLVYEFMSNTSIDRFLFDPRKRPLLAWSIRYKIILGIARGLQYLHEDSRLCIIHHVLKPSNILLDKDMNPKIADFGLAKFFEGEELRKNGSQGYMAPEYMMTREYSVKSDVYSFGIMILEIVSGQKNRIIHRTPQKEDLTAHVWRLWNEGRSFDVTDPALYNNCSSNDVIRCIQIGLLCLQGNAEERPTMTEVVYMLNESIDLPSPSSPAMYSHQFSITDSYSSDTQRIPEVSSAKTVTWRTDLDQDLYPVPR